MGLSQVRSASMLHSLSSFWSFHVQYGQPAAFSLKAPTFAYLFISVVVRALRFDPKYVIACAWLPLWGG